MSTSSWYTIIIIIVIIIIIIIICLQNVITAEELAGSRHDVDQKIRRLLSLIKWASAELDLQDMKHVTSWTGSPDHDTCMASGCGLSVGLVRTKCKIDLHVPDSCPIDIQIAVSDPEGRISMKQISSAFHPTGYDSSYRTHDRRRALSLWKIGAAKLLAAAGSRTTAGHSPDPESIQISYEPIEEGQIRVSYTPALSGEHVLAIKWRGNHIGGSPFLIKVVDSLEQLNITDRETRSSAPVLTQSSIDERLEKSDQSLMSGNNKIDKPDGLQSPVTAAVLNRTSKVSG